jgi:hypothetical protein
MIFIVINIIAIALILAFINDKFTLQRLYPKNPIILFSCQFFGSIAIWFFAGWLATIIYPSNWLSDSSNNPDENNQEQCYDRQGTYQC